MVDVKWISLAAVCRWLSEGLSQQEFKRDSWPNSNTVT